MAARATADVAFILSILRAGQGGNTRELALSFVRTRPLVKVSALAVARRIFCVATEIIFSSVLINCLVSLTRKIPHTRGNDPLSLWSITCKS
jgi:hypothetical protein